MTGNRSGRQLSLTTRRELIQAIAERYHGAARADKKKILDEFIEVTGFHGKHAIRALRKTVAADHAKLPTPRPRIYDQAVVEGLTILWEAADRICGKRLKCAIPERYIRTRRKRFCLMFFMVARLNIRARTIPRRSPLTSVTSALSLATSVPEHRRCFP